MKGLLELTSYMHPCSLKRGVVQPFRGSPSLHVKGAPQHRVALGTP